MANKIQIRRDTAANWTSADPTLSQGEQGYETDTGKLKIGDGSTAWTSLGYSFEDTTVGGDTGVDFNDNVKARFGTGNDLEIYHNGTSSIIENTSAGQYLRIRSAGGMQFTTSGTENALIGIQDSKVGLYYDGSEKLETTSSGIQTTGTVNVNGAYTLPTSDGTNGQVLTTDGSGAVTFADAGGGGGDPDLYADNWNGTSTQPSATGENAVALGFGSVSSGWMGMALGTRAVAYGSGNTTWGMVAFTDSYASGKHSLAGAIGSGISSYGATGQSSVAFGQQSKATSSFATAIGMTCTASGSYSTAIGDNAVASHANGIAIGDTATTSATNQIALGGTSDTVKISGAYTLPTSDGTSGQVLTTDGSGAVTFADAGGGGAALYAANEDSPAAQPSATGSNAIAIGDSAQAGNFDEALAIGTSSFANNIQTQAVGYSTSASGNRSSAFGRGAIASGAYSTSIGYGPIASGDSSIALGRNARAVGTYSTALGNSYTGGTDSFAAAIVNNTSSYGATGANSVAIGYQAKATNADAIAFGDTSTASGGNSFAHGRNSIANSSDSVAIGIGATSTASRSFSFGDNCIASASYSFSIGRSTKSSYNYSYAFGYNTEATRKGVMVYGGGQFASRGDAQSGTMVLRRATTDATATVLTSDGSTPAGVNQVILPNNSAYSFSGTIIARESAAAGSDYASWEIKGALLRDANAASTVLGNGIVNKLYATSGASAWAVALSADTTNGGLKVEVTGAAATNIRWVATVNTSEVTYA